MDGHRLRLMPTLVKWDIINSACQSECALVLSKIRKVSLTDEIYTPTVQYRVSCYRDW